MRKRATAGLLSLWKPVQCPRLTGMEKSSAEITTALDAEAQLRAERLREIVLFCLERLGGRAKVSQRKLAQQLGLAPTMITRYLTGQDPHALKVGTLEQLALVAGVDAGAIHAWIHGGRSYAMSYQRRVSDALDACQPLDLARELVRRLETAVDSTRAVDAGEFSDRLRELLASEREEIRPLSLYERLLKLSGAEDVVDALERGEALTLPLTADAAEGLARFLRLDKGALLVGDIRSAATDGTRTGSPSA